MRSVTLKISKPSGWTLLWLNHHLWLDTACTNCYGRSKPWKRWIVCLKTLNAVLKKQSLVWPAQTFWFNEQRFVSVHCLSRVNATTDSLIKIYWVLGLTPKQQRHVQAFYRPPLRLCDCYQTALIKGFCCRDHCCFHVNSHFPRKTWICSVFSYSQMFIIAVFRCAKILQSKQSEHESPSTIEQLNFLSFFNRTTFLPSQQILLNTKDENLSLL